MERTPRASTFPISSCPSPGHRGDVSRKEAEAGILPSHGISVDVTDTDHARPTPVHHLSAPAYQSPLRHHRRQASEHRVIKETLNAESRYTNNESDGKAEHHINQYIIKDEIGRGSFGAVHLAVDQYGKEYAVKEFSKSRLRKRAQSYILRRPRHERRPGHLAAGMGLNAPLHRHSVNDVHNGEAKNNPLYLIKEEIAIMKKLNHPNLVSLFEVLDDPEEDSLYMVLEMCKKGVLMKVGLGEVADPYDPERCRHWFRDLILGIEYLHAQGIVHRDIKPDNLLLTEDDVLKVVDFGVSEMFEKQNTEMLTAKSAGSPAFLPPELCVTKHGDISGKAADIWSMGVSLYCLRYGSIPFEQTGVLELYEAIRNEELSMDSSQEPEFSDLIMKLLEKDPKKRIVMDEIRAHPWVTRNGTDPLLSKEDNTAELVEMPSELEVNHAITAKLKHLITLMKAVRKFKSLVERKRPLGIQDALDRGKRHFRQAANADGPVPPPIFSSKSDDTFDRQNIEGVLAAEGIHSDPSAQLPRTLSPFTPLVASPEEEYPPPLAEPKKTPRFDTPTHLKKEDSGDKGHAHDPLDEVPLFLGIGAGSSTMDPIDTSDPPPTQDGIAESPTAADFSIYDTAYQEEVERIRAARGKRATVYLTRRVDNKKQYREDANMVDEPEMEQVAGGSREGIKAVLDKAREKSESVNTEAKNQREIQEAAKEEKKEDLGYFPPPKVENESAAEKEERHEGEKEFEKERERKRDRGMRRFSEIAKKAVDDTKAFGVELSGRSGETVDRVMKKVGVGGSREKEKAILIDDVPAGDSGKAAEGGSGKG